MADGAFTFAGTSPELTALEAVVGRLVDDQAVTDPRLDALEGRAGELENNVGAIEANVSELEDGADDTAARVAALVTSTGTALASLRTDLAALAARVATLEPTQPVNPPAPTVVDDADAAWTWTNVADWAVDPGAEHRSRTVGARATVTVAGDTGGTVDVFGLVAPDRGQAIVTVDGAATRTIDEYAATASTGPVKVTTITLASGRHVLEFTVTGAKQSVSTGTRFGIDRLELTPGLSTVAPAVPPVNPPPPPPPPPTGTGDNSTVPSDLLPLSAWPAIVPVTHGYYDLNPRKLAVVSVAGKPDGYYLRGVGVSAPAALKTATRYTFATAGEIVRDQRFVGAVSVTADGVTFVNCEMTGGPEYQFGVAFANGSSQNAVKITNGSASFVDCTIQGAQAGTVVGAFRAFRTLIREGGDAVNTRITSDGRGCEFYQSVIDGSKRNVPEKHSDAIQSTTNSPSVAIHTLKMDQSWDQVDNDRTGDYGNSCWQMGHFGSTAGGVRGTITRSALSGGNYKLNAQSDAVHDVTLRDNVLVQNSRYGDSTGGVAIDYSVNVRVDEQGNRI